METFLPSLASRLSTALLFLRLLLTADYSSLWDWK
jgi:hypothetical protein